MGKVWVLDSDTKGTGARMVPLEEVITKPDADSKPMAPQKPMGSLRRRGPAATEARLARQSQHRVEGSTPLPAGHVRKKATGEIGRVRSVDARAGTASVHWLKQGRTSTVSLAAISRR